VLNVLLLMSIVILPFTTSLMAQYLDASDGQHLAALLYGSSFLLMSLIFFTMQRHLLKNRAHLLGENISEHARRSILRRNMIGIVPYTVATAAALLSPYLTLAICGIIAIFYALPATTADPGNPP
jgi:uncharacterized membrane protein